MCGDKHWVNGCNTSRLSGRTFLLPRPRVYVRLLLLSPTVLSVSCIPQHCHAQALHAPFLSGKSGFKPSSSGKLQKESWPSRHFSFTSTSKKACWLFYYDAIRPARLSDWPVDWTQRALTDKTCLSTVLNCIDAASLGKKNKPELMLKSRATWRVLVGNLVPVHWSNNN